MAKVLHNTSIFQSVGRSIVMNVNLYVYAFRAMDINNESKRVQRYVEQWVSFVSLTFSCLNICINFPFLVYITRGFISFWHLYSLLMVLQRKYYISRKEYLIFFTIYLLFFLIRFNAENIDDDDKYFEGTINSGNKIVNRIIYLFVTIEFMRNTFISLN